MRWLILVLGAIPAFALWAWVVFVGTADGWWRAPLAPRGDTGAFMAAAAGILDEHRGNAAFRLLSAGRVAGERYVSPDEPVGPDSRFQVASVSKWLTAWGVMRLVEAGRLELDAPVATYLTRWQFPEGRFGAEAVTIRRLLSHTAGLADGLGYEGFAPGEPVQALEDSLDRAADAVPGASGRVTVDEEPGEWRYSGGGYALLQLVIEEVTGEAFEPYMQRAVLDPLGLGASSFALELAAPDVAPSYDTSGQIVPYRRFSAPAAAGLFTTAADLTRFLQAHLPGDGGELPGRGVLQPETLRSMREPHASAFGTEVWGLGHMLYAENGAGGYVIGHDGMNSPAVAATARLDPDSGDGIVLLTTGNPATVSRLGGEWVFWHTGRLDIGMFYGATGEMMLLIGIGWGVIVAVVVLLGWMATRGARARKA